jgi:hypothetical protein
VRRSPAAPRSPSRRGQNTPSAITVDDKNLYWANQGLGTILEVAK